MGLLTASQLVMSLAAAAAVLYAFAAVRSSGSGNIADGYGRGGVDRGSVGADQELLTMLLQKRSPLLDSFRGGIMLLTCICILAVDFRAFPSRFAKTDSYGTGLMDLGVGGIVIASGLVHKCNALRPLPWRRRLGSAAATSAATWCLGFGRMLSLRACKLHQDVGEYGVHWNFFCTIAVVGLLSQVVSVSHRHQCLLAVTIAAAHQMLLAAGLAAWLDSPTRGPDLFSQNREGLVSCLGFWALFHAGSAMRSCLERSLLEAPRQVLRLRCGTNTLSRMTDTPQTEASTSTTEAPAAAGPCPESASAYAASSAAGTDGTGLTARAAREVAAVAGMKREAWLMISAVAAPTAGEQGGGTIVRLRAGSACSGGQVGAVQEVQRSGSSEAVPGTERAVVHGLVWGSLIAPAMGVALLWLVLAAAQAAVGPISRRSCNLPYILWTVAHSSTCLLLLAAVHVLLPTSQLLLTRAVSSNMLLTFLAANLLTGAINVLIDTSSVGDGPARLLVCVYMSIVCAVPLILSKQLRASCAGKRSSGSSSDTDGKEL
ncbi:MAG: hypothetical protein WDW38_001203 [Sanguina aurantia]